MRAQGTSSTLLHCNFSNHEDHSWRHKEAALFMLQQIVEEHKGDDRAVAPDVIGSCISYVSTTMNESEYP